MVKWVTISIPEELYESAATLVPSHGASVSEFCRQWIAIGVRFDKLAASSPELAAIAARVTEAIKEDEP
jgi:hypothetical protein